MELKISIIDTSIAWEKSVSKRQAIKEMSDAANNLVASNDYGESIKKMLVGLIVDEPIYDAFYMTFNRVGDSPENQNCDECLCCAARRPHLLLDG